MTKTEYNSLVETEKREETVNAYVMMIKTGQKLVSGSKKIENRLFAIDAKDGCSCHSAKAIKGRYINHASEKQKTNKPAPNLKVKPFWVEHEGWYIEIAVFHAVRKIEKGEELLFAYNDLLHF